MSSSAMRPLLAGMLVAAAMLAGACGGEDAKPDKSITRPQFIAKVDALCRKVKMQSRPRDRKLQALVDGSGSFSSRLRKGAPLLREFHDVQRAKVDRIKRFEQPPADRAEIAKITAAADAALKDLEGSLPAADRGDLPSFIDTIFDASGQRATAERLGEAYGLRSDCFGLPVKIG